MPPLRRDRQLRRIVRLLALLGALAASFALATGFANPPRDRARVDAADRALYDVGARCFTLMRTTSQAFATARSRQRLGEADKAARALVAHMKRCVTRTRKAKVGTERGTCAKQLMLGSYGTYRAGWAALRGAVKAQRAGKAKQARARFVRAGTLNRRALGQLRVADVVLRGVRPCPSG
ncbi:MAG: hypothetical protein R3C15_14465 [Thermoleophilia bacterium]